MLFYFYNNTLINSYYIRILADFNIFNTINLYTLIGFTTRSFHSYTRNKYYYQKSCLHVNIELFYFICIEFLREYTYRIVKTNYKIHCSAGKHDSNVLYIMNDKIHIYCLLANRILSGEHYKRYIYRIHKWCDDDNDDDDDDTKVVVVEHTNSVWAGRRWESSGRDVVKSKWPRYDGEFRIVTLTAVAS